MSMVIFIGPSGDKLATDLSEINSLDALKAFVESKADVAANKLVFLTAKGKQVRPQSLLTENEIYAFDSSLLSEPRQQSVPSPTPYEPGQPPDSISDQTDLQSWHSLFAARLEWAVSLREACALLVSQAQKHAEEQTVIHKSLGVAVASLSSHMRNAEEKYTATEEWCEQVLVQQEKVIDRWKKDYDLLESMPARPEFARFIATRNAPVDTLQHFVDVDEVNNAGARAKAVMISFAQRIADLKTNLASTAKSSHELLLAVEQSNSTPADASLELLNEIDIIVNKMRNDMDHVATLPTNSQGVSRASKMALLHTRNYLPNLTEFCGEINDLLHRHIQARNEAAHTSLSQMQTLAIIEGRLSKLLSAIKKLDISSEDQQAFGLLNIVGRLPHVYGSLMIEAIRRREWAAKSKKESATLVEEMATYQEEETRRRKKWLLSVDDVVNTDLVTTKPPGVELSLRSDEREWPVVSRQELQEYIQILIEKDIPVQELQSAIQDLDRPTKKQLKLARNAFKNGSVHDGAFGSTSIMMRGGGDVVKLEEELRGQRSRVRKLEDLLHRQANMQRNSSAFSPMLELVSEDTSLQTRIASLEAELQQANIKQAQFEEAVSTKKDIMENMEAQKREFADERRVLEGELREARSKIEDFEDENEKLLESREHVTHELDRYKTRLRNAYSHLSGKEPPLDPIELSTALEGLSKAMMQKHAVLEAKIIQMTDDMVLEKAHSASLSSCLNDERAQLHELREKMASGESGADALRKRVEEKEGRVITLTESLSQAESQAKNLDAELKRVTGRLDQRGTRATEVSQRLYSQNARLLRLLDQSGFVVAYKEDGTMVIERASKVNNSTTLDASISRILPSRKTSTTEPSFLHWSESTDAATEETAFAYFTQQISLFDVQVFSEALSKRLRDFEYTARKWSKEAKSFSSLSSRLRNETSQKIAVRDFKEGDLALFLPTRGELGNKGAWAAFNIGAPHHFLREKEGMGLNRREWLVARISRIEERVVDLKKRDGDSLRSVGSASIDAASFDSRKDDNPFELSDGLTWYMVHASEDKAAAPSTPGLGTVTVASSTVDAKGSIRKKEGIEAVKTLGNVKSLDSRRSSEASRKGEVIKRSPSDNSVREDDQVRRDLLFGP
ncbi:hypothetical protein AAFC00_001564 [Neodothiora populina]|uniref:Autophagy-related protein 11 n=1 Tax=Neodothiora populina TaxID=2781224 RepID=A0ABR3PPC4_9PEZI